MARDTSQYIITRDDAFGLICDRVFDLCDKYEIKRPGYTGVTNDLKDLIGPTTLYLTDNNLRGLTYQHAIDYARRVFGHLLIEYAQTYNGGGDETEAERFGDKFAAMIAAWIKSCEECAP